MTHSLWGGSTGHKPMRQSATSAHPTTDAPIRVQRKRSKGWKMPPNTVYVGRGSKWGNPHRVGISLAPNKDGTYRRMTHADAVARYRDEYLPYWMWKASENRIYPPELKGKNLACWCALDQPCHADVLLKLANAS